MHSRDRKPLQVLITVDTEAWPYREAWRDEQLAGDIERDIYGATPEGEFGLAFQCGMLRDHGLKAVFFVETLMASVVGLQPLRRIVETVRSYEGQTVELHAHPEWTRHFPPPGSLRAGVTSTFINWPSNNRLRCSTLPAGTSGTPGSPRSVGSVPVTTAPTWTPAARWPPLGFRLTSAMTPPSPALAACCPCLRVCPNLGLWMA